MPTPTECVCCQEITATSEKIETSESHTHSMRGLKLCASMCGFYKPATITTDITMGHVMYENLKMSKL